MQKRRTLTKGQKTDILVRERWTCRQCKQPIHHADLIEWDHALALARGGKDELDNIVPLHIDCHKLKTFGRKHRRLASDIFEIAKTKRLIRKRDKPKPKTKIPSRGFSKHWRRKMDGTTERND